MVSQREIEWLGNIPPYYYSNQRYRDALIFFGGCIHEMGMNHLSIFRLNDKLSQHYIKYHKSSIEEIDSVLQILPEVRTKLEEIGLLTIENNIVSPKFGEITSFYKTMEFMHYSIKRRVRWCCYFLYYNHISIMSANTKAESKFTIDDVVKLIGERIDRNKIILTIDGIRRGYDQNGIIFERNGDQCYIKGDIQLVSKYLVSGQRRKWGSKLLGDVILEYLDLCAYSNNDLSRIVKADKSTISRKMQQLKYYDLVKPVFTGGPDRIYYITNCENCPWDLTIEECRDKSITTLQKIFKERYNIKLEKSTFSDIKDNHTLKHVSEVYRETSSQSYIEMEKQKLMDRLMTNITNSFKNRNRGRNSKNKDSSLGLPLPRTLDH